MNESTPLQNPPRSTPTAVLWLMAAVVIGGSAMLAGLPAEPPATQAAAVTMSQLQGSAAHRGAVIAGAAQARMARAGADAPLSADALSVAALQAP
jgi:hypothetical protein